MVLLTKIVNGFKSLTIFTKISFLDVRLSSDCTSFFSLNRVSIITEKQGLLPALHYYIILINFIEFGKSGSLTGTSLKCFELTQLLN